MAGGHRRFAPWLTPEGSLREFRRFRRLMLFEHFQGVDDKSASKDKLIKICQIQRIC